MRLKGPIHYAWIIVAIAATMGFITSSVRFAAAALVPHLRDSAGAFGWSSAQSPSASASSGLSSGWPALTSDGSATVTEFAGSFSRVPCCSSSVCCSPVA